MADRYSFSLTTFSPSGKLVQIEYALEAVNNGVTAVGIKAANGVVLATEKKLQSSLEISQSVSKISRLTPDTGAVYAGMSPDYRVLVDRGRKVSHAGYKRIYNEYPPTRILVQDIARVMQEATQSGGVRPFGVSLLVGGWDESDEPEETTESDELEESAGTTDENKKNKKTKKYKKDQGPSLYQVDPSGAYYPWKATAIGKNSGPARTFLEKRYYDEIDLEDAVLVALLTLKESFEGEMTGDTIEIGIIGQPDESLQTIHGVEGLKAPRFRTLRPSEIDDYLSQL